MVPRRAAAMCGMRFPGRAHFPPKYICAERLMWEQRRDSSIPRGDPVIVSERCQIPRAVPRVTSSGCAPRYCDLLPLQRHRCRSTLEWRGFSPGSCKKSSCLIPLSPTLGTRDAGYSIKPCPYGRQRSHILLSRFQFPFCVFARLRPKPEAAGEGRGIVTQPSAGRHRFQ